MTDRDANSPDNTPQPEDAGQHNADSNNSGDQSSRPGKNDQPEYGVRLQGEELVEWQKQQAAKQANGPVYGSFTPYNNGADQNTGAEYGNQYGNEYGSQQQQQYNAGTGYGDGNAPYAEYSNIYAPGQGPYPGPGGEQFQPPTETMEVPTTIKWSRWLLWIAGAIYVIICLIPAFTPTAALQDTIQETMDLFTESFSEEQAALLDEAALDPATMVPMIRVSAVFQAVLGGLAYFLIAHGIYKGSRVARVFGTIFAVFSLFSIFSLSGLLWVGLGVVAIILSYLPASQEYFRYKAWEKFMSINPFFPPQQPPTQGGGGTGTSWS